MKLAVCLRSINNVLIYTSRNGVSVEKDLSAVINF